MGQHFRLRADELVVVRASDVEPEQIEWLWPDRVAIGKLTLLAGNPGDGKSQFCAFLAAKTSVGGSWPCGEGTSPRGGVILLSAEDDLADTVRPRLMAAGANSDRIEVVQAVRDHSGHRPFNIDKDLAQLEALITERQDVKLVIMDPISSYVSLAGSQNAAIRAVLERLGEMAARLRVAVLAVTHLNKRGGLSAMNRVLGSIAYVAAARSAYLLTRDPSNPDRRLILPLKSNIARRSTALAFAIRGVRIQNHIDASTIEWEAETLTATADEVLSARVRPTAKTSALTEAEDFLRDCLADGPVHVLDVQRAAADAGLKWPTVRRAQVSLGIKSARVSQGGGGGGQWRWQLSAVSPPAIGQDAHVEQDEHGKIMSTLRSDEHLGDATPDPDDGFGIPEFLDRRTKPT